MKTYAHYGCGKDVFSDHGIVSRWINIDSFDPRQFPIGVKEANEDKIFRCDLTRPHPFPDLYFDGGYSEHFIEHLTQEELIFFLMEVHRTFRPGAQLRLSWPSLDCALVKIEHLEMNWAEFHYHYYERFCHKHFPCVDEIATIANHLGFDSCRPSYYQDFSPGIQFGSIDKREDRKNSSHFVNLIR